MELSCQRFLTFNLPLDIFGKATYTTHMQKQWSKWLLTLVAWQMRHKVAHTVDALLNRVPAQTYPTLQPEIADWHKTLFVADLHSDPLLWNRDLRQQHTHGHIDIPRLQAGNVRLQVIATASHVPFPISFERSTRWPDLLTLLWWLQKRPFATLPSHLNRVWHQAQQLHQLTQQTPLTLIRTQADLANLQPHQIGTLLAIEGVHALRQATDIELLFQRGFRMVGLSHFIDHPFCGSAHGVQKGGLTANGRQLVHLAQNKNMLIDLAHASPQTIRDVLDQTSAPVLVSHAGMQGIVATPRNLSDTELKAIASTGGLIGVAFFPELIGGTSLAHLVQAICYASEKVGVAHVAIGTDFDGAVRAPISADGYPYLTQALLNEGFQRAEVAQIMGGNVRRLLLQTLPTTS